MNFYKVLKDTGSVLRKWRLLLALIIVGYLVGSLIHDYLENESLYNPRFFLASLVVCEILFNIGIFLMLKGSGIFCNWRDVMKFKFENIRFKGRTVWFGFHLNRLAALFPFIYLVVDGWGKVPTFIIALAVLDIGTTLGIYYEFTRRIRTAQKINIRNVTLADVDKIVELDHLVWKNFPTTRECLVSRIKKFPRGNFVAILDGEVIGYACVMRFNYEGRAMSWNEITGDGTLSTHIEDGKDLFGVALTVHTCHQQRGVGALLMVAGGEVAIENGLEAVYGGSRIPHYHAHAEMSPQDYVLAVGEDGRPLDPELSLYKKAGFKPMLIVPDYIYDPESLNFGVIVRAPNPFAKWYLPKAACFRRVYLWAWRQLGLYLC